MRNGRWTWRCRCLVPLTLSLLLSCSRAPEPVPPAASAPALHALLLSGGHSRERNFYSHLEHLRRVTSQLVRQGVPPERIDVFSSDGADPKADLATREGPAHPGLWRLPRKSVAPLLRPPLVYVNSEMEGRVLWPATRSALREWFEGRGSALRAGDTLLLYVTDHGTANRADRWNANIALWHEMLSVEQLEGLLGRLDPGVRVVLWMSQCFSGSFASLGVSEHAGSPGAREVCGFFSTTADRTASGCYPETSGKPRLGHTHRMLAALEGQGSLRAADWESRLTDRTPDVPHATSDVQLERLLEEAARVRGVDLDRFVDERLESLLREPARAAAELDLLDRVARSHGLAPPRSLAELETQTSDLSALRGQIRTIARRWLQSLDDLVEESYRLFLTVHPEWSARLRKQALRSLDAEARHALTDQLLNDLERFTARVPDRERRLRELHEKFEIAKAARIRIDQRAAGALRLRMLLVRIAGVFWLAESRDTEANARSARLDRCEGHLFDAGAGERGVVRALDPERLPSLEEERELLATISPAWLGVRYEPLDVQAAAALGLERGAVRVTKVEPGSPAARAALREGDVLIGPAGAAFAEPHAVREFVMRSPTGEPISIRVLRGGEERRVDLVLEPYPLSPRKPSP